MEVVRKFYWNLFLSLATIGVMSFLTIALSYPSSSYLGKGLALARIFSLYRDGFLVFATATITLRLFKIIQIYSYPYVLQWLGNFFICVISLYLFYAKEVDLIWLRTVLVNLTVGIFGIIDCFLFFDRKSE